MSAEAHRFEAGATALAFILAGNAYFTLVSGKTGVRFTYRVSQKAAKDGVPASPHFVSVLSGPDNTADYAFLGTIFPGKALSEPEDTVRGLPPFVHGRKSRIGKDAPSARAFAWAWPYLARGEVPPGAEVWHEGRCGKCGRALTVPESIASGLGPVCAGA